MLLPYQSLQPQTRKAPRASKSINQTSFQSRTKYFRSLAPATVGFQDFWSNINEDMASLFYAIAMPYDRVASYSCKASGLRGSSCAAGTLRIPLPPKRELTVKVRISIAFFFLSCYEMARESTMWSQNPEVTRLFLYVRPVLINHVVVVPDVVHSAFTICTAKEWTHRQ